MSARVLRWAAAVSLVLAGALHAQCPDGSPPPCARAVARASAPDPHSIAVLYFLNQSRDSADAYVADGLTEAIATRLNRVGRLEVVSAAAVRRLRNTETMSIGAIGNVLRVTYLVSGSVRRAGNRVRVSAELLRANGGTSVWAGQFDHTADDPFGIEEAVAESVAANVSGRLLPAERAAMQARPTQNAAAYDHFLRGNFLLARRTLADDRRAVTEYEAAIRLDPRFAAAHARLSYAYRIIYNIANFSEIPRDTLLARGVASADRALALDSNTSDGWVARGYWAVPSRQDWAGTGMAFRRAVQADPRNPEAWHRLANYYSTFGIDDSATAAWQRALTLDPSRAISMNDWALHEWRAHRFRRALQLADSGVALEPASRFVYARWSIRLVVGDTVGARDDLEKGIRIMRQEGTSTRVEEALLDLLSGDDRAARALVATDTLNTSVPMYLGMDSLALARIERIQVTSPVVAQALKTPTYDRIRNDPRFLRVVREIQQRFGVRP
jgi:TolB-like protein/Tfp pilus assembly protein PilF